MWYPSGTRGFLFVPSFWPWSNYQLISEQQEERKPKMTSESSNLVDGSSEADVLRRLLGIHLAMTTHGPHQTMKISILIARMLSKTNCYSAIQEKHRSKIWHVRPENRTSYEDNFYNENDDVVGNVPNTLKKSPGLFSSYLSMTWTSSKSFFHIFGSCWPYKERSDFRGGTKLVA